MQRAVCNISQRGLFGKPGMPAFTGEAIAGPQTMSSREIAELTGKRPGDVIRDIRTMLDQLGDDADLRHVEEVKDMRGYTACFLLPKDLTITLVSGYSVPMRHRIVTRWMELEGQQPAYLQEAIRKGAGALGGLEA